MLFLGISCLIFVYVVRYHVIVRIRLDTCGTAQSM